MDYLISQYIDNELDLDEKAEFVNRVHADHDFTDATQELLRQEKQLRKALKSHEPELVPQPKFAMKKSVPHWPRMSLVAAAMVLITLLSVSLLNKEEPANPGYQHRFVLFQPGVQSVEITGSFTRWQVVPLKQIGESGYWEVTLEISPEEHRYVYILNQQTTIADPTQLLREQDEFGSMNTVFNIKEI